MGTQEFHKLRAVRLVHRVPFWINTFQNLNEVTGRLS